MTGSSATPSAVIFDLGGVLMDFSGLKGLARLTGLANDADLRDRWAYDPWQQRLERGLCSAEEFAVGLVADWNLAVTPHEFLVEFASWPTGPFAGTLELLLELSGIVSMGCLSNTNAVHWQKHLDHWGVVDFFEWTFVSHELGMAKPDAAIYRHVIDELDIAPDQMLFLDDRLDNVEAARALGIRAEQTRGITEVRASIERNFTSPG